MRFRRSPILATLTIAACTSLALAKPNAPASTQEIRRTLTTYAKAHPTILIALETLSAGKSQTYFVRGSRERSVALDDRTLFEIGSITKTFTATLLAQMASDGEVRLSDPIATYLPAGVVAPTYRGIPITLASLAEHRSGLPSYPPNLPSRDPSNPYAGYTIGMMYRALERFALTRAPGARYEYSNFPYGLLGPLLADRAHEPYPTLIAERILRPLGMNDTAVGASEATKRRLAPAFTYGGQSQRPWDLGALSPAGSLESDLHDMAAYLRANMNAPRGSLGRAMFDAQRSRAPEDDEDSVGLAWETSNRYGFVHKAGGTGGYSAVIAFDRRAKYGMVFMANVANSSEIGQLVQHLITPATVAAPTDWAHVVKEPSPFSGRYPIPANGPRFAISIFEYRGKLYIETPESSPEPLSELKGNHYAWGAANAIIDFTHDRLGRVTGLTALQDGQITRARREP